MKILTFKLFLKASIIFIAFLSLIISSLNLYIEDKLPEATEISEIELQVPLKIYTSDKKLMGEFGEKRRSPLNFEDIPPYFVKAVLAAEDDNFFNHSGVSYLAILRSVFRIVISGRVQGGGSTITMQVAGNYLTGRDVNVFRKVKDIFLAYRLENNYSKEEIFEFYVNRIFLGNRAYGIAAASEVYYGDNIENLNIAQWAMIAGLPKAPSTVNPIANPRRALIRRNWILGRMLELGFIYPEQYELSIKAPVSAKYHGLVSEVNAPYISETIRRFIVNEYGLNAYREGFEVHTTLNSKLQNNAAEALKSGLEEYDMRHGFRPLENYFDYFPDNFFLLNIESRLSLVEESQALPIDYMELPDGPLEKAYNLLKQIPSTESRFPTLVIGLNEELYLLSRDRNYHRLSWDEGLKWARPYISEDQRGARPKSYSDFIKEGDLVWLKRDKIKSTLSLTQIPEAQGSLVAMNPQTGAVKALVGGYDFFLSKFNRATQSFPLLGSNYKPFLVMATLCSSFSSWFYSFFFNK